MLGKVDSEPVEPVNDTELVRRASLAKHGLGERRGSPHELGPQFRCGANETGFEQAAGHPERIVTRQLATARPHRPHSKRRSRIRARIKQTRLADPGWPLDHADLTAPVPGCGQQRRKLLQLGCALQGFRQAHHGMVNPFAHHNNGLNQEAWRSDRPLLRSSRRLALDAQLDLLARFDLKLPVDVAQVPCDRVARHEKQLGDLTVGQAFCSKLSHPSFRRSERIDAGDRRPARPCPAAANSSRISASSPIAPQR